MIDGFTIRDGRGSPTFGSLPAPTGGGIVSYGARLALVDLVVRDNVAAVFEAQFLFRGPGSGVAVHGGSVIVERCRFIGNGGGTAGGGLYVEDASSVRVAHSTFLHNRLDEPFAALDALDALGAAIAVFDGSVHVERRAFIETGGSVLADALGGAIHAGPRCMHPTVATRRFAGNGVTTSNWQKSGAVAGGALFSATTTRISSASFVANAVFHQGGNPLSEPPRGGAIAGHAPMEMINGTFLDNLADSALSPPPSALRPPSEPGLAIWTDGPLLVRNTILAEADAGIDWIGPAPDIAHVLVGVPIDADGPVIVGTPTFLDDPEPGMLRLAPGSPGIDAGDNAAVVDRQDAEGFARICDETKGLGPDATVDHGAHERQLLLSVVHVRPDAAGTGASWDDARGSLADGLDLARATLGEVWIAAGAYRPATDGDRHASFRIADGVTVLGGFAGQESSSDERDASSNVVTLTGDQLGDDDGSTASRVDDSLDVVRFEENGPAIESWPRLDGVTVTGGAADQDGLSSRGGGVLVHDADAELRNVVLSGNRATASGGGPSAERGRVAIVRGTVADNHAGIAGGGLDAQGLAEIQLVASHVAGTVASRSASIALGGSGGPGWLRSSSSAVVDSHATEGSGAGIAAAVGSRIDLRHVTIAANVASTPEGAGVRLYSGAEAAIIGTILHANVGSNGGGQDAPVAGAAGTVLTMSHSLLEGLDGTLGGIGNLDADPGFVDPTSGDWRLAAGSPAIDAGDGSALEPDRFDLDRDGDTEEIQPLDLFGGWRLADDPDSPDVGIPVSAAGVTAVPDIGAAEFDPCPADLDGDGLVELAHLLAALSAWGPCPGPVGSCPPDLDGDGAVGLSDLLDLLAAWGSCG